MLNAGYRAYPSKGYRRIRKAVECGQLIYILPDAFIIGMEDVRAVPVHVNAVHVFVENVAPCVVALVDDKTAITALAGFVGKGGAKEPRPHNEVIVSSHDYLRERKFRAGYTKSIPA